MKSREFEGVWRRGYRSVERVTLAVALLASCGPTSPLEDGGRGPFDRGDGLAPRDVAIDADGPGDGPGEGGTAPLSGPMTHVVSSMRFTAERVCDLDGDGVGDNAVADLGSPAAELAAGALTAGLSTAELSGEQFVMHYPWIDDLSTPDDPSFNALYFHGDDDDDPSDPSDDFSGHELFYASSYSLDGCGEPLFYFLDGSIENGTYHATAGTIPIPVQGGYAGHGAQAMGTVEPGGTSLSAYLCGYGRVVDIGRVPGLPDGGDMSLLEVLLAGGTQYGLPSVSGVSPDVDVDGDGLERFVLDEDEHIVMCIDGDLSEIPGRECFLDPRMADGISLALDVETTSARFGGREEGWEDLVTGECEDGPPDPSLFDPQ